jgi:hypothetical protein
MDALALPSCDAAASAGTWRRKLPAAHMAPASQTLFFLILRKFVEFEALSFLVSYDL